MRLLWIGIGCRRGTSKEEIEAAIAQVFHQFQLSVDQIAGIATVDRKSDEPGLLEFCEAHQFSLSVFSVETLNAVALRHGNATPNPALDRIGTPSVAEAAARLASGSPHLMVPKQVIAHRMTIAIAQIPDKLKSVDLAPEHEAIHDRACDSPL